MRAKAVADGQTVNIPLLLFDRQGSDGRTKFDRSSGRMVDRPSRKLALIGKSVRAFKRAVGNLEIRRRKLDGVKLPRKFSSEIRE